MKFLFHHRIASRDGQAVHLDALATALRELGHEVVLIGPAAFHGTGFGGSDPRIDRIKRMAPPALFEMLECLYNIPAAARLDRAVRIHRPDIVYERFSLFLLAGIGLRRLGRLPPLLLEVNSPLFEERAGNDGLMLHFLARRSQRAIWRNADRVLPVTRVLARTIEAAGIAPDRIAVIPNGIDPAAFSPDRARPPPLRETLGLGKRIVLGFTGFVRGWNAVDRLLGIVARHRDRFDLHILVVGDGPARSDLIATALSLGISDRLTITGTVAHDDIPRHVAAFDIAVLPGVTAWSSPLKLFEYLAAGRAIVAPGSDNIREILTDRVDALLFEPNSDADMERAILELCADPNLRHRIAASGRSTVAAGPYTWRRNAERVVELASALLAR